MSETIVAYKGFDKDLKCRGFQYEVGKEYEEPDAKACEKGFHACEMPLDVLSYYEPGKQSRYCVVEQSGVISKHDDDSKVASSKIKIGAEIGILGLVKAQIEYVKSRCTTNEVGKDNTALTGGSRSALTGGSRSALTGGSRSALTGGSRSALTGGDGSALTGGDGSALTGGSRSALTGGSWSALTGGDGSALTGGDGSALTGGSWSALTGGDGSVLYGGEGAKLRGGMWSVLAFQIWKNYKVVAVKTAVVDGETYKPDTWYTLKNGEIVETE